jgi:hypothetical protein
MITDLFNFLKPAELIILEQHMKLGMPHLKKLLTEDEIKTLLKPRLLDPDQKREIGQDDTEITGNLSLILNTIFTSVFGAWMGYAGILGSSLGSVWAFGSIVTLAGIVGALIGYQNVRHTKKQARKAIQSQKLLLLQIEILKEIEKKRREEVWAITQELHRLILDLSRGTSFEKTIFTLDLSDKSKIEITQWVEQVEAMGREKCGESSNSLIREAYAEEWAEIQAELKKNVISILPKKEERMLDPSLVKLIHLPPKKSVESPSWIKSNTESLIFGLIPTLLGGCSSVTVYLGGIPKILQDFGYSEAYTFFTNPIVRGAELTFAISLTLFFGFSFAYSNWKSFTRYRERENTNQQIIQREGALTLLDAELLKLKEVKRSSLQLMRFFKIADRLNHLSEA